jgi:hypothetical protein
MIEGEGTVLSEFDQQPVYKSPRKPSKPAAKQSTPVIVKHELDETELKKTELFFEMHSSNGLLADSVLRVFCENFGSFHDSQDDEESIQRRVEAAAELFKAQDSDNDGALDYEQFVKFVKQFLQ